MASFGIILLAALAFVFTTATPLYDSFDDLLRHRNRQAANELALEFTEYLEHIYSGQLIGGEDCVAAIKHQLDQCSSLNPLSAESKELLGNKTVICSGLHAFNHCLAGALCRRCAPELEESKCIGEAFEGQEKALSDLCKGKPEREKSILQCLMQLLIIVALLAVFSVLVMHRGNW